MGDEIVSLTEDISKQIVEHGAWLLFPNLGEILRRTGKAGEGSVSQMKPAMYDFGGSPTM